MKFKLLLLIVSITLSSCSISYTNDNEEKAAPISKHSLTMATLYSYYADEYRALTYQAFNIAWERIDKIRTDHPNAEKLAILVDIDETLLDNSPFEALMIAEDTNYPYMWNEWCNLANANAIPGAVEFLQYADETGFNIFYVSNRKKDYVQEATMNNLSNLGFPQISEDHFLLRLKRSEEVLNPSDKQMRRDEVSALGYEIVMMIGDNLGDFYSDAHDPVERSAQLNSFKEEFGRKFIMLPNAMYGNWTESIGATNADGLDSLLINMTKAFN